MSGGGALAARDARAEDAAAMAAVLAALVAAGRRSRPADAAFVRAQYLDHPARIRCTIAVDAGGAVLGFQSLKVARAGNPYDTPEGWGIIGTHVAPDAARRGVGRALFAQTLTAARGAGLARIEALVGADNAPALAYYAAFGFAPCGRREGSVRMAFEVR